MLSRNCGRRVVHGNDNNSNIIELQWISDSCTAIVSVLPYYYYCQRIAIISIVVSLLTDDNIREDDLILARVLEQRNNAGAEAKSSDRQLLNCRNGLLRA